MPGPLIGLAPATIAIMRMAAQQGIKLSAKQAAKLAAKRSAGLQAATAGTNLGRNIGTASEGLARRALGSKAFQDATLATAIGSIPAATGIAGYLYGSDNPREEPVEDEGIEALIRKDNDFANGGTVKRRVPDVYFQRYQDGGEVNNRRGKTLSDEEIEYIASNSLGQIAEPMGSGGFGTTYPEIRSSVFGNDNNIENLSTIEDVNQLEKLYRAFSNKNLSRADLDRIHARTMNLYTQMETPVFNQEYNLEKDIFKFGSNKEFVDDYRAKLYPEYTGDREGLTSLIKRTNSFGGDVDEYNEAYDTLEGYRGEENLRLQDQYRTQEFPILEEALQEKLRKRELDLIGPDGQTGEIERVESMIPNLISRTDEKGQGVDFIRKMYPNMGDHQILELMKDIPDLRMREIEANLEKDFMLHGGPLVNPSTGKVDYFNEEGKFNQGGSVYNIGDPGPSSDEPFDGYAGIPYGDPRMPEVYQGYPEVYEREKEEWRRALENNYNQQEGSDTTYGDDAFAREVYEKEQIKKQLRDLEMQEILEALAPGEGLAHGGAVRPRGYNMGGAVMPQQQQPPQGIATMVSDPRTNMGNMPNQQQQQLAALQKTATAANLNANNLQKSIQAQQQKDMQGGVTTPISQVRIPSIKRRQFEDTLLNSRRRGQKAGQMAQGRASIPATIFG